MYDGHKFSIRASMAAVGAELARAEGSDKRSDAFQTTIAVGRITSDQLVWVTRELNARLSNEIEQGKFIVC